MNSNHEQLVQLTTLLITKVDKIDERVGRIDVTMARNTDALEYHIKRTNLLEADLKPVKEHVQFMRSGAIWATKITGIIVSLGAIAGAVWKILGSV